MLMKYKDFKMLSTNDMKQIVGGNPPEEPGGGEGPGCYKCCWTGTSNCGSCARSYEGAPCVSGATLVACPNQC